MPKLNGKYPSYRFHKNSRQAIVTLDGKDFYLGEFQSEESKREYDRLIQEWLAGGRRLIKTADAEVSCCINDIAAAYDEWAEGYYRKADGSPTQEIITLRQALKPLILLYGDTPAKNFGPIALKAVREKMIKKNWCRRHINTQISRIKSMFRWAAEQEWVPGSLHHALLTVRGLKQGRCEARESEPVRPVHDDYVQAIKPHVSGQVWAMIQLQLFTGARPGEICSLRKMDIDNTGDVWSCRLEEHKTAHHGHKRVIFLGRKAQAIIQPFLDAHHSEEYLFSPSEAEKERREKVHAARKTPLSCGNRPGTNLRLNPARTIGLRYDVAAYRRAIARGCDLAFPPPPPLCKTNNETHTAWMARLTAEQQREVSTWQSNHRWHPHQLRHNAATRYRKERGLDAARAILGHRSLAITQVYAELDMGVAIDTIREFG